MPMFANAYKFVLDHCEQEDATINLNGLSLHFFHMRGLLVNYFGIFVINLVHRVRP